MPRFNAPTFNMPATVPERRYPAGVVVESSLRVWAFSRRRGSRELARCFLQAGFAHLPEGSVMFRLEELRTRADAPLAGLIAIKHIYLSK